MSKQPTIVVNKNTPQVVETFSRLGNVIALDTREVTKERVQGADILVVRSETSVDRNLLEGTSVRFVGTMTIGTDHIDLPYLASRGIEFASAPGCNANSVAEYVAAALLVWSTRTGRSLAGTTIGIVGVGNVGSKVINVAHAFGMNVLLNDPPLARKTGNPAYRMLDDLMDADFITLHVPLTKTGPDPTNHFFNERLLKKMKRGAVLINTSRGAVVETAALKTALSSRHLSKAMLDVWENEPAIDTELLGQVMLGTPHIAGYSLDGKLNAVRMVYEAVCRFLQSPAELHLDSGSLSRNHDKLRLPVELSDPISLAGEAVRHAYDIMYDDTQLRKLIALPPDDRGRQFMKLRAEYRTRREFSHNEVELLPEQANASDILRNLGFRTSIMKGELKWAQ
jgi:erythronate-4-phosphate dehydrogenase